MRHGRVSVLALAFACTLTGVVIGASWTQSAHAANGLEAVQLVGNLEQPMFFDRATGDLWVHNRLHEPETVLHLIVSEHGAKVVAAGAEK